jgi:uncharacterized protein YqkB
MTSALFHSVEEYQSKIKEVFSLFGSYPISPDGQSLDSQEAYYSFIAHVLCQLGYPISAKFQRVNVSIIKTSGKSELSGSEHTLYVQAFILPDQSGEFKKRVILGLQGENKWDDIYQSAFSNKGPAYLKLYQEGFVSVGGEFGNDYKYNFKNMTKEHQALFLQREAKVDQWVLNQQTQSLSRSLAKPRL